ncbi:hypothetical protein KQI42_05135 [Tissierella sp. MSJ-40]|uniref:Uncharacterized protein n=1 Tax=Tissierella simiarum TaxID=2841534 RepID=A0ABS6E3M5_9FIRM|nr:hypothetical protein [Tissierella simiarum]MBU5437382.1 hypothetical protein [Tissierella simiarum]
MDYNQGIDAAKCNDPISIGATCVARIDDRFFLLIEIEIKIPGRDIQEVIVIEITAAQAAALIAAGVMRCQIVDRIPTGMEVNLICAFVVGTNVFLVFNVENMTDRLVLVRVPLCTII